MSGPTQDNTPPQQAPYAPAQQPAPQAQQPPPQAQQQPAVRSGPNALDTLVASMSRAELAILAGSALILLIDVIFWFVDGYSLNTTFFGAAGLAVLLILARKSLPVAVAGIYQALVFVIAVAIALIGARNAILDVLLIARPPAGASAAFMLGFVAMLVATAVVAYGAFLLWKGRTA